VARIPCRACFRAVDVHPDFMERDDAGWVLRCPECHMTFPVRDADSAAALALRAGVPVGASAVGRAAGWSGTASTGHATTGALRTSVSGTASALPATAPVRVLVVDDDPDVRLLLHAVLASPDIEVVGEAADGFDALEAVAQTRPDVIVLDLMLPTLSGLDVLRVVRHDHPDVRVVAVSAMASHTAERDALAAGADLFVSKLEVTTRLLGAVTGR